LNYRFPKSRRLCSRLEKERLLREGEKFFVYPILLRYLPSFSGHTPVTVTASLPPVDRPMVSLPVSGAVKCNSSGPGDGRLSSPPPLPSRVMFIVAKKKFPRAVDRNGIRRKLREAWRLQATAPLTATRGSGSHALFLLHFVGSPDVSFDEIRSALGEVLTKLPRQGKRTSIR
jgi:ribonuclease P protein component